jgi:hypothetical protein
MDWRTKIAAGAVDCGEAKAPAGERRKAVKILARSLFRDMIGRRYDWPLVVAFATELIELISDQIRPRSREADRLSLPNRRIDRARSKSSDDL